jgi:hypothetical protein
MHNLHIMHNHADTSTLICMQYMEFMNKGENCKNYLRIFLNFTVISSFHEIPMVIN